MELTKTHKEEIQKTELGTIPRDWIATRFGEAFTGFSSGMTPYRGVPKYYTGDIPWITSGELNYNVIKDTAEKITQEAVLKTNLKVLPEGTFLMAITGLEAAGTRGSCAITGVEATTNQSCMALFPISGKSITEYLYHFYVYYGNELAFKYCQGTKQQSFTGRIAKKLPINLPPTIEEQKAIAQVLSDTDALIQALEKKIAKKKLIKKGVMQKLLTPKEGWNKKALGDLAIIKKGEQLNRAGLSNNDKYPVINGGVLPSGYTNVYNQEENTITISEGGNSCGYVNRIASKFWQGGHCYSIESDFHYGYLFHFLKSRENEIMALRVGSGLPNIQRNRLLDFIIHFPEPEEQDLIAIILTDLDKEIENLERKLSKYQLAKQGMMQKLLTGKIRLV